MKIQYILLVFGIIAFMSGFHEVDLAMNFNEHDILERDIGLWGNERRTYYDMYNKGVQELFLSLFVLIMFGVANGIDANYLSTKKKNSDP